MYIPTISISTSVSHQLTICIFLCSNWIWQFIDDISESKLSGCLYSIINWNTTRFLWFPTESVPVQVQVQLSEGGALRNNKVVQIHRFTFKRKVYYFKFIYSWTEFGSSILIIIKKFLTPNESNNSNRNLHDAHELWLHIAWNAALNNVILTFLNSL